MVSFDFVDKDALVFVHEVEYFVADVECDYFKVGCEDVVDCRDESEICFEIINDDLDSFFLCCGVEVVA